MMNTQQKNETLLALALQIEACRSAVLQANKADVDNYQGMDQAMYDRMIVNDKKVDEMIKSVNRVAAKPDPVGAERYHFTHENGMQVSNRTAPFGTIMIIYESRPDVTIEAAILAFKTGNRIILKGGKEARHSNLKLIECWHQALEQNGLDKSWVRYLDMPRAEAQEFLKNPDTRIDLIVPRGGERLIEFVKTHASCPVLVSGRGNNFLFVHKDADLNMAVEVIINAKTSKISACNALDKVLIDRRLAEVAVFQDRLKKELEVNGVEWAKAEKEELWYEEFLAMKIMATQVDHEEAAIAWINKYSGGHSASIITKDQAVAEQFMQEVDAAAVYHNASTRFTDGGQFGLGAELAISTDKLHHRGPLGLEHLVTNKWYVFGEGQIR